MPSSAPIGQVVFSPSFCPPLINDRFDISEIFLKGPKDSNLYLSLFSINVWPRGNRTFFMLNSTVHEIFPAHKC